MLVSLLGGLNCHSVEEFGGTACWNISSNGIIPAACCQMIQKDLWRWWVSVVKRGRKGEEKGVDKGNRERVEVGKGRQKRGDKRSECRESVMLRELGVDTEALHTLSGISENLK